MRQEGIGRATHEPLGEVFFVADEARQRLIIPTRRKNGIAKKDTTRHVRVIYKSGYSESADPNVFINMTEIEGGNGESPTIHVGENNLQVWTDRDRSVQFDYQVNLGLQIDQETTGLFTAIMRHCPQDQFMQIQEEMFDPYSCTITPDGIRLDTTRGKGGALFEMGEEEYSINVENPPRVNEGWSGSPPQRHSDTVDGIFYEFVVGILEIPPRLAFEHRLSYGTLLGREISVICGIKVAQGGFRGMKSDVDQLVSDGLKQDAGIREMVNPFFRFTQGNLLESI